MLTGGLSPAYLIELVENYDEARILFTGYQAPGTPGHTLQQAEGNTATVSVSAWPITNGDLEEAVADGTNEPSRDSDEPPTYTLDVPTHWVHTISGMSGHAARNTLLQFARKVDANHVALIHGDPDNQRPMVSYLEGNLSADIVTRAVIQSPIPVYPSNKDLVAVRDTHDVAYPTIEICTEDEVDSSHVTDTIVDNTAEDRPSEDAIPLDHGDSGEDRTLEERVSALYERIQAIDEERASRRNDSGRSEAELRALIRDEVKAILDDRGLSE